MSEIRDKSKQEPCQHIKKEPIGMTVDRWERLPRVHLEACIYCGQVFADVKEMEKK